MIEGPLPTVVLPEGARLLRLPNGDWIDPAKVTALRIVSERADPKSGMISACAALCADGSWYKVPFEDKADAQRFVDALAELSNRLTAPKKHEEYQLSSPEVTELILGMRERAREDDPDA